MTVRIENETEYRFSFDIEDVLKKVIFQALDEEECPYECEVEVLLTDNESIREMNLQSRGIDAPTDVLSFPMAFYDSPADFDGLEDQDDVFHPETGEYILGDIVLSVDKIKEQAEAYGHSEMREAAFLTAHSMLHLMGYDHETDDERLVMEEKQEKILATLGITRD